MVPDPSGPRVLPGPRARRAGARFAGRLVLGVLLAASTLTAPPPAAADPILPPGANDAVRALVEANARAADANEAAMGAREDLPVKREQAERTRETADAARIVVEQARVRLEEAYVSVDQLTRTTYQGGDLDQLGALLASPSPQSYLDKIELLDTVASANAAVLRGFLDASAAAETAGRDAEDRAVEAGRAADDAERALVEAERTQEQAEREIEVAEEALDDTSAADLAVLRSGGTTDFPTDVPGDSLGIAALRVALTQQGKPYLWGAQGPSTFDCSGLVLWAYRQIGVGMPRVARAQQQVGLPVEPGRAQPGDLIFYGSPATHVGIYVGDGRFLEAPQSGDVVKVSPVRNNVSTVRRISL